MSFGNDITIVGNATRDPELRYTASGAAVCRFGLAWNRRNKDGTDEAHFFDVTCWQDLAANVAETVEKGMRVVVVGRLQQRSYEAKDGTNRSVVEIVADDVAPSLRWATADVAKTAAPGSPAGRRSSYPKPAPDHSEDPF